MCNQILGYSTVCMLTLLTVNFLQATEKSAGNFESPIDKLAPIAVIEGIHATTTRLKDRMNELKIPGFSIAVIHNDKIDWAKGYGRGFTTTTLYQAASISKPVTAMAVMHLVQKGIIDPFSTEWYHDISEKTTAGD